MTYTEEQVFMNTIIRLQIISTKGTVFTKSKAKEVFSIFDTVVKNFSRFNSKSELSLMNKSYPKVFKSSKELFGLVKLSLELNKLGKGFYDPTLIDLLESYGYDKKQDFSKLDKPDFYKEISGIVKQRPSPKMIILEEKTKSIKLQKNQRIDLGSIAKGYAVDLAYDLLKKDFDQFLINAGGDVRVAGVNEQGLPWRIMLYKAPMPNQASSENDFLGFIELEPGMSIASSGGWARRVGIFHHLISPIDGLPINHISQTYMIASNATYADAYSTFLFVEGPDSIPIIDNAGFSGLLIDFQGNIFKSKKFNYNSI